MESDDKAIGLADRIVDDGRLLTDAVEWAQSLCLGPASAVALSKSIMNRSVDLCLRRYLLWFGGSINLLCE